jgi:adenine-specific DNA-methyltransferase
MKKLSNNNISKEDALSTKLRGGYYTPRKIADSLCSWAIKEATHSVLEPSCGDGVFVECAAKKLLALGTSAVDVGKQVRGIEIVNNEARKARIRAKRAIGEARNGMVVCADYFRWFERNSSQLFDCAVGNPPFVRYQNFPEPSRSIAMRIMELLGLKANRLTNAWVPFVAAVTTQLKPGGRLAMVVPAELLQVTYASQLREFLITQFHSIDILTSNELLFQNAEQEVVLMLAEGKTQKAKGDHSCRIDLIQEGNWETMLSRVRSRDPIAHDPKVVHHDREKWLKYFLTNTEISLMRELRAHDEIGTLGYHGTVDVGVVTGKNEFFVLSKGEVREHQIEAYVIPLVSRSVQLKGANLSKQDWDKLSMEGHKVHFFYIEPGMTERLTKPAQRYVNKGEHEGLNNTYKCSIRENWYSVPAVWAPDCFLFRQIYDFPRIVKNSFGATSTDTIHRVRCKGNPESFLQNFYTYLTAASSEIEGRSYGGGVLELEPTEGERLLMPKQLHEGLSLAEIDRLIRGGDLALVLEENSRKVLVDGIGLSQKECTMMKEIWEKMRERRHSRGRGERRRVASEIDIFELEP